MHLAQVCALTQPESVQLANIWSRPHRTALAAARQAFPRRWEVAEELTLDAWVAAKERAAPWVWEEAWSLAISPMVAATGALIVRRDLSPEDFGTLSEPWVMVVRQPLLWW